jgi:nucleotide-binding universal stress UspA family protein
MLRLVVVPLDGSSFGEQALPLAIRLAERHRAELELVHVYEALPPYLVQGAPPIDPTLDAALRKDRKSYLDAVTRWLASATAAKVTATLLTSRDVTSTLAQHVAERRADLVVMATHGRGGLSKLWLGAVATDLVRQSETPVLLMRPTASGSRDGKAEPFRHTLLPLDGTPADEEAIDNAIAIAGDAVVDFLLLHVIVPVAYLAEPVDTALLTETALESAMDEYLEEVARRIRARGFSVATRVIADPSPAHAILEVADERDADLIAMETHARTGLSRVLIGSVTDKVIRAARAPVLVHRRRVQEEHAAADTTSAVQGASQRY